MKMVNKQADGMDTATIISSISPSSGTDLSFCRCDKECKVQTYNALLIAEEKEAFGNYLESVLRGNCPGRGQPGPEVALIIRDPEP